MFFIYIGNSQSKLSLSGDLYYGYHQVDNIHGFGIGSKINYKAKSNMILSLSMSSIFGESRGIVPDNSLKSIPIRDFETYSKESGYFDNFLVYYPSTFNKYYVYTSDFDILYNKNISLSKSISFGGGVSLVYFDLENIDYVFDTKFYHNSTSEEDRLLMIPRYDRFYDIGLNIAGQYEYLFKEYMVFRISPSINYYFKSGKMIYKNSIGIGFYF